MSKCRFLTDRDEDPLLRSVKDALNQHIEIPWWTGYHRLHDLPMNWNAFTVEQLESVLAWTQMVKDNPLLKLLVELEPPF